MHNSIKPYVVNTYKILKALKSDNPLIKEELKSRCEEVVKFYKSHGRDEAYLTEMRDELINGNMQQNKERRRFYLRFLMAIIEQDMYPMEDNSEWTHCDPNIFFEEFYEDNFGSLGELGLHTADSDIRIFFCNYNNLAAKYHVIDNYAEDNSEEALGQIKDWIFSAREKGCDLVLFNE